MFSRSIRLTLALLLTTSPLLATEPSSVTSLEGLEAALFSTPVAPTSVATLGTCRVSCRLIGGTVGDVVQYQWQTTYALCCDPAIQQCDDGYRAFGLSFNSTKCNWF